MQKEKEIEENAEKEAHEKRYIDFANKNLKIDKT